MLIAFAKRYKYQIVLIFSILIVLYPLTFFILIPKWDNINGYLPYRYFISDYLWNGHLPLWNPFQLLGYPGYSDLQSGAWNPIVWTIMLFGKYTINSLIVELLSCYVLAGLGMYKLSNYLYDCKKTGFILGLSYALSGFMVGSSQLMVFLIAVTWFPWCIYALIQFFKTYKLRYQLMSAFFMALFITGASPSYTIILAYIVVGLFLYQLVIQKSSKGHIKNIIIGGCVILFSLVILLLPYINSFIEFSPYFNRVDKLAYNGFLLNNPFTPVSYISFILPHSVIAKSDWFNITDLSLRNGYFGFLGLIICASSLLSKLTKTKIILLLCIIVSLLIAAGDETFLFKYLYHLPGFGVFRHPSMFRAFTIFCCLLLGGYELKYIINNGFEKRHKAVLLGAILLVTIAGVWAITKTSFTDVKLLMLNTINYVEFSESALSTHLLLNSLLTIGIIILTIVLKRVLKFSWFISLAVFCLLDLGIQSRMTIPTTVCYNFKQDAVSQFFKELPNEINQEGNYMPLKKLDETQPLIKTAGIWQNLSTYNKTISFVGVNPMRFKNYDIAKKDGKLDDAIEQNIFYIKDSNVKLDGIKVGYNQFSLNIAEGTEKKQFLILNQNYHHLWQANLNGEGLRILPNNGLTMKVEIPANSKGKVQFVFKSPKTIYLFIISLLAYLILVFYLLKYNKGITIA